MQTLRASYPNSLVANDEPLVAIYDNFLTDRECEALIAAATTELQRALVSDGKAGITSQGRTGKNAWVNHYHNGIIGALSTRVANLVGIPLQNAESLQVIHYEETQEYGAHYDAWDADTERGQRCMARGGQRLVTCLMYLNTVPDGGGTGFPNLDIEITAQKGRMVIFHNCFSNTNRKHPDSLHGGLPVAKGEKWACNLWFRERVYQKSSGANPHKMHFSKRF